MRKKQKPEIKELIRYIKANKHMAQANKRCLIRVLKSIKY